MRPKFGKPSHRSINSLRYFTNPIHTLTIPRSVRAPDMCIARTLSSLPAGALCVNASHSPSSPSRRLDGSPSSDTTPQACPIELEDGYGFPITTFGLKTLSASSVSPFPNPIVFISSRVTSPRASTLARTSSSAPVCESFVDTASLVKCCSRASGPRDRACIIPTSTHRTPVESGVELLVGAAHDASTDVSPDRVGSRREEFRGVRIALRGIWFHVAVMWMEVRGSRSGPHNIISRKEEGISSLESFPKGGETACAISLIAWSTHCRLW
mmetsp:Transcript_15297/g.30461  ORF Transcript_15297/g.30461 Transcript_15297/m.30461 type:complete len:269 (-) Transcript_15297:117-923(-)